MKANVKHLGVILLFFLFAGNGMAQENYASNISRSIDEEKMLITFDIASPGGARSFSVLLLLTFEGRQVEASSAYGDVGSNISPGKEKAIVWYYKDDFDGDIEAVDVDVLVYRENEPRAVFEIASVNNNGYAPCEVTFSNRSSYANEYQWNFGDPSSGTRNLSFDMNPSHTYREGGIYPIALTARNTQLNLENTYYQSIEIKGHDSTVADFKIEGNNQLAPAKVDFRNESVNADRYHWNFGDPSGGRRNETDKEQPTYKYRTPGTYTVELIAINNFSGLSDTLTREVVVEQEKVAEAGFIYTKSSETAPATVVFKNTSVHAVEYEWDFGDPSSGDKNSSKEKDPVHIYTQPGTYEVELSAWARGERKPSVFTSEVSVKELPNPPEARFTIQNNNVLGPATIVFENHSVNAETYFWDFGDPDSGEDNYSDKKDPTHTYQKAGRYKVLLTASSSRFTTQSTKSDYVVITEPSRPVVVPVAKFSFEKNNAPAPAVVQFTGQATDADTYSWNFGDVTSEENTSELKNPVHVYSEPGRYRVTLTVSNSRSEKSDQFSDFVTVVPSEKPAVAPVAKFTVTMEPTTAPAVVRFSDASAHADSYAWSFGDPGSENNTSTMANPSHTYSEAGTYQVELTVTNKESGLIDRYSETITVSKPLVTPVAGFEIQQTRKEAPSRVVFVNQSKNANSYVWNFGDPASGTRNASTEEHPEHVYENPGQYKVELAVLNAESGIEKVTEKKITVISPPKPPVANFDLSLTGEYVPVVIDFTNLSENADSYKWNFGDFDSEHNVSSEASPNHTYTAPGKYKITLEAMNSHNGEKHEISKEVILRSNYTTFIKSDKWKRDYIHVSSVVPTDDNNMIILVQDDQGNSTLVKMTGEGKVIQEQKQNHPVFDLIRGDEAKEFILLGTNESGTLQVQKMNQDLKGGNPVTMQQKKKIKTDFAQPFLTLSLAGEIGLVANILDDRYPVDILFQKTDRSGRFIPLMERTFRYVGTKLATAMTPTDDGGFAVTGYWQEENHSPYLMLFGKIDRNGKGEIHLIHSQVSILGCDILEAYLGGYAVLELKEDVNNPDFYKMSFILIDDEGGPTACATSLPGPVKKEDILKYTPRMIKTRKGYVVANHGFNGLDYDLCLFWVDQTGNILETYEILSLPGDQFVMDFAETGDGSLIITGLQRVEGEQNALVIKTDPQGKLNPVF
jgi:PKD repeat protein